MTFGLLRLESIQLADRCAQSAALLVTIASFQCARQPTL